MEHFLSHYLLKLPWCHVPPRLFLFVLDPFCFCSFDFVVFFVIHHFLPSCLSRVLPASMCWLVLVFCFPCVFLCHLFYCGSCFILKYFLVSVHFTSCVWLFHVSHLRLVSLTCLSFAITPCVFIVLFSVQLSDSYPAFVLHYSMFLVHVPVSVFSCIWYVPVTFASSLNITASWMFVYVRFWW